MQVKYLILSFACLIATGIPAQLPEIQEDSFPVSSLFRSSEVLPLRMRYSQKDLRRLTNDSTYMTTFLAYQAADGVWKDIDVKMRVRGNYRLKNCYFPPVKLKIKNPVAQGTLFEGSNKLKLVLPCLLQKSGNDMVLKEYLAYKFYEVISPYHFKTRLTDITFQEEKGKNFRGHFIKGIFIEDIDNVAHRYGGNEIKRSVHPLEQEGLCSVRNDFFQFMIGNTDYSLAYRHNQKLIFVDKKTIPIPYDFDMSGLVDAGYAVVSQIQGEKLEITDVTQRLYRGFRRSPAIYQLVREEYLSRKETIFNLIDSFEGQFTDQDEFRRTRGFIKDFYDILENDSSFGKEILAQARTN